MKKPTKQVTTIGIFVIAALVLLVGLIVTMGGNKWAQESISYKMFFSSSVKGLTVGAPVMFRGISIGEVSRIHLAPQENLIDEATKTLTQDVLPVEVHIRIFPERLGYYSDSFFKFLPNNSGNKSKAHGFLGAMVQNYNLRAELGTLSILTGQIYVSLNFVPKNLEEPDWLVPKLWQQGIIPSRLSFLDRLSSQMHDQNFNDHIASLKTIAKQLAQFVDEGGAQKFMQDISTLSANLTTTSDELKRNLPALLTRIQEISAKLDETITRVNETLIKVQPDLENTIADTRTLVSGINGMVDETKPNLNAALKSFQETLDLARDDLGKARTLLETAQTVAEPGSVERERLQDTLIDCDRVLNRLSSFLDTINKNPQALLLGN